MSFATLEINRLQVIIVVPHRVNSCDKKAVGNPHQQSFWTHVYALKQTLGFAPLVPESEGYFWLDQHGVSTPGDAAHFPTYQKALLEEGSGFNAIYIWCSYCNIYKSYWCSRDAIHHLLWGNHQLPSWRRCQVMEKTLCHLYGDR